MKLSELHVDNFKATAGLKLDLSGMTALVGVNGSGKTTILEALAHFFRGTDIPQGDYRDSGKPVTISVKFVQVTGPVRTALITRTWTWVGGECVIDTEAKGMRLSDPDNIIGSTHVVFEHAEHETDNDGTDKSDLDIVRLIKSTINEGLHQANMNKVAEQNRQFYQGLGDSIVEFQSRMNQKLGGGEGNLAGYAPGFMVDFRIRGPDPEPRGETLLVEQRRERAQEEAEEEEQEEGQTLAHRLAGHGTKRAYHMAALEAYAEMASEREGGRLVLLLVDEPELHQHPQRLRRILQIYKRLAGSPGFQVIYSTHSPGLVDLGSPEGIYSITRNAENTIVANPGAALDGKEARWSVSKSLAEGIFSAGVILIEGPRDEVLLEAIFSAVELEGKSVMKRLIEDNIHMVQTTGVSHMPDFVRFFQALKVPTFAIWDGDTKNSEAGSNRDMLNALESESKFGVDGNGLACALGQDHLCFANDAGMYFREYLGLGGAPNSAETRAGTKRVIDETPDLVPNFKTEEFLASEFATSIVPHIYNFFPRPA